MGRRTVLSPTEEVLNWQSKNALAQNDLLMQIDQKINHVKREIQTLKKTITPLEKIYQDMVSQVHHLDKELRCILQENQFGLDFIVKEPEIRILQKELDRIHREKQAQQQKQVPVGSIFLSIRSIFPFSYFTYFYICFS
jgi:predicted RNase H-like nuclease (RuvC/YqgF family)